MAEASIIQAARGPGVRRWAQPTGYASLARTFHGQARMRRLLAVFVAAAGLSGILGAAAHAQAAQRHMIVAAERDAAEAGRAILRAGGSAVDAAIAAQLVLTLVEPQSSGIGGGAYIVVSDGERLAAYDGRETAPASAGPNMYLGADGRPRGFGEVRFGGISVGVPGTVAVMAMAHQAHGRLAWSRLFEPAIELAERGFSVPERLADGLEQARERFAAFPDMRENFYHPDGSPYRAGETMRNPAYAAALRRIAAAGPDAFYRGDIAGEIAAAVMSAPVNPVAFTRADLAGYEPKQYPALCGYYRAYRLCSAPPSTSGGVTVLQILGVLQRFPSELLAPGTASSVHLISEASRLAYADRDRWLGDPDFIEVPAAGLLDSGYLNLRAALIRTDRAMGMAEAGMPHGQRGLLDYAPMPQQPSFGTSHLAAVDGRGQVVSMTMTIQAAFGAAIIAGGFILNNELTDFSFQPTARGRPVANAAAAGKRPLSSMSPFIVFAPDGQFYAALGSPGGRQIIAYVAQGLSALIDGDLSMSRAAANPRHVNLNGPTVLEEGTPLEDIAPALTAMGHQIRLDGFDSGVNGIRRVAGGYEGGADPRRSGVALGD